MSKKKLTAFEKGKIEYDEFVKSLEGKTNEELLAIEQELIKTIDKHDRKVAKTQFKISNPELLPEAVEIAHYFLNKQRVGFNYAIAMTQLYESFNKELTTIPYPVFDMLLTTFGSLEFTGYDEWKKIIKFNDFTKPYSDEYAALKSRTFLLAEEHSTLQSKLGLTDSAASNESHAVPTSQESVLTE